VVAYRATRGDRPSIKSLNVEEREAIFQASYDWSVAQMMLKPIQGAVSIYACHHDDRFHVIKAYMQALYVAACIGIFASTKFRKLKENRLYGKPENKRIYVSVYNTSKKFEKLPEAKNLASPESVYLEERRQWRLEQQIHLTELKIEQLITRCS
jgi:hypothetical protein